MNDVVKVDSSLAAMQFMLVARDHGYETNPIGGFEADQLAEAFGLDKDRYVPVIILSIGKAVERRLRVCTFSTRKDHYVQIKGFQLLFSSYCFF